MQFLCRVSVQTGRICSRIIISEENNPVAPRRPKHLQRPYTSTPEEGRNSYVSNELNNTWKTVTDKSRKFKKLNDTPTDQFPIPIIPITNRYHALHNLQNEADLPSIIPNQHTKYHHIKKVTRDRKTTCGRIKQQKKIIVIGDSHARGLANELQNYLGHEYSISGTIIPGACLNNITQLANKELTNLN